MGQQWDKNMTNVAMCFPMWHKYDTWDKNVKLWLPNVSTMWQKFDKFCTMFTNVTQGTSWTKRQRNLTKKWQSKIMLMMINEMMVIVTSRRWWSRRWWSCWSLLASLQSQPSKPNFSYILHTCKMCLKKPPQKKNQYAYIHFEKSNFFFKHPAPYDK